MAVLVFALVKEFIIDIFGKEHDPFMSSLKDFTFYMVGAAVGVMLALPGNEDVEPINPLVGETNDGYLNDIRGQHITREDVFAAIKNAKGGPVEGARSARVPERWRSASRAASEPPPGAWPPKLGGYTVGALWEAGRSRVARRRRLTRKGTLRIALETLAARQPRSRKCYASGLDLQMGAVTGSMFLKPLRQVTQVLA